MSNKTLEQVLEHLLNKEEDKASDMLHQFFVEKGRSIYEELMKADEAVETEVEEAIGGAQDTDLENEIIADQTEVEEEEMFSEGDDDMPEDEAQDDLEAEMGADDEEGADEPAGEEAPAGVEDAFMDVEDALAALKAEFEKIVGGEDSAEEPADEMPAEEPAEESFDPLGESADLIAAPTPVTKEQGVGNTKSGFNGAKPAAEGAEPVKFSGGADEKGRPAPTAKEDNAGNVNVPGNKKAPAHSAVKAPAKAEAAGKTSPISGS